MTRIHIRPGELSPAAAATYPPVQQADSVGG